MSTAEIIAELPRLSPAELAQVDAKLRELIGRTRVNEPTQSNANRPSRIPSPRLAQPQHARDFLKQVVELRPDAKLRLA